MDLLLSEFVQYLIKFVVLGALAVAGVICGSRYKKGKLAKESASLENSGNND